MGDSENSIVYPIAIVVPVKVHQRVCSQLSTSAERLREYKDKNNKETQAMRNLNSVPERYPKTAAERMRAYRARIKNGIPIKNRPKCIKSDAERAREHRAREKGKSQSGHLSQCCCSFPSAEDAKSAECYEHVQDAGNNSTEKKIEKSPMNSAERTRKNYERPKKLYIISYEKDAASAECYGLLQDAGNNPNVKKRPKTPAERARDYRARKKAAEDKIKKSPMNCAECPHKFRGGQKKLRIMSSAEGAESTECRIMNTNNGDNSSEFNSPSEENSPRPEVKVEIKWEPDYWNTSNMEENEEYVNVKNEFDCKIEIDEDKMMQSPFQCVLCSGAFLLLADWVVHMQQHTQEDLIHLRKWKLESTNECKDEIATLLHCEICHQHFNNPDRWLQHVQESHTDIRHMTDTITTIKTECLP